MSSGKSAVPARSFRGRARGEASYCGCCFFFSRRFFPFPETRRVHRRKGDAKRVLRRTKRSASVSRCLKRRSPFAARASGWSRGAAFGALFIQTKSYALPRSGIGTENP